MKLWAVFYGGGVAYGVIAGSDADLRETVANTKLQHRLRPVLLDGWHDIDSIFAIPW